MEKKDICIIGAGRVGITLAAVISKLDLPGVKLHTICSPTEKSRRKAAEIIGNKSTRISFIENNLEGVAVCNCIMICTPDDIIEVVCSQIAKAKMNISGKLFIHFSGAKSLKVMEPVRKAGGIVLSIHPIKSFASIEESINSLPGTIYGVTYQEECPESVKEFINYFINRLDGKIIEVEDDKKSIYHAAACIASNYLVSLINYAVKAHEKIGIKSGDSLNGLIGLIEGTVSNIRKFGTKKSLTGPVARGDLGTVKEHMENFRTFFKEQDYLIYKVMGAETARLAYENGWIEKKALDSFLQIFSLKEEYEVKKKTQTRLKAKDGSNQRNKNNA